MFNEKTKKWEPMLFALVTDVIYTDEGTEVTEPMTIRQLAERNSQQAWCESNNGGDAFATNIEKRTKTPIVRFFTSSNKEGRIVSNAAGVNASIIFPFGWEHLYPAFYNHLTKFLRYFKGNAHDDDADCLTAIYEKEIVPGNCKPYRSTAKGIRRGN